jgi:hypothetical protein
MTTPEPQHQQPQPPPPGYGHYPPPPPQKTRKWPWVVLAVVAFFVVVGIASGDSETPASLGTQGSPVAVQDEAPSIFGALPSNNAEGDVKVTKCDTGGDAIGMADIEVRITNSTNRTQSYMVTVSVNDAAGNRLTEANGASNSVSPGQAATAELLASAVDGAASCAVANVSRFPS